MKPLTAIFIVGLLLACIGKGLTQGFINLGFESANISAFSSGSFVPTTNAVPGWNAYIGGVEQKLFHYNGVTLGAADVQLQDTNGSYPSIQKKYSIQLWGEFNPSQGQIRTNTAAIGQTGQIPVSAQSLVFWGSLGGLQATFNGQLLAFNTISNAANYTVYGADISAYAGQTGQLLFTSLPYYNGFGGPTTLDNIQFSSTAVPEPAGLAVAALGGLLFVAAKRWRRS